MSISIMGCDVSLNHSAFVLLEDGELADFWYFTNIVGSANRSNKHGTRLPNFKFGDKQTKAMHRLNWIKCYIETLLSMVQIDYVGIEDYAVSEAQGAHYLGEIGGIVRLIFFERGVPMRLHDPVSIKMFVTHNGRAQKDQMEISVAQRWGRHFSDFNAPINPKTSKRNRQTSEDLADAFSVAKLVWTEVQLRNGAMKMNSMHEKEIQVFNRVTKSYPINLLARDWIHWNHYFKKGT